MITNALAAHRVLSARGVATLWDGIRRAGPAAGRAAVLAALDAPRSTSELARRLGLTAGAVSQHVGSLRAAGLLTSEREGRGVLHARTALAEGLVGRPGLTPDCNAATASRRATWCS